MKQLESEAEAAFAFAEKLEGCLGRRERAYCSMTRSTQQQLSFDPAGTKRLLRQRGTLGGHVRLVSNGRVLYLDVPIAVAAEASSLLNTARGLLPLGAVEPVDVPAPLHAALPATGSFEWENTAERPDLAALAADTGSIVAAVAAGTGPTCTVQTVRVAQTLEESVHTCSEGLRAVSRCYGVEVQAVATTSDGVSASLARYAASFDRIDLAGLGQELALTASQSLTGTENFDGDQIVLTPNASAQLLRHVAGTLLLNPLGEARPLCAALIDDGRAADGHSARGFDCEGTPTGRIELVGRDGAQYVVATRTRSSGLRTGVDHRLTGHAVWDSSLAHPQLAPTNVLMAPTGYEGASLAGTHLVVVDVRSLGVEEHRATGQLALRLLAVRSVDGVACGSMMPMSVGGSATDFLAAILAVGNTASYHPGVFSVAGAYMSMSIAHLLRKGEA
jgi:predicted Zn-dependent protease